MSSYNALPFQQALYTLLSGDATLDAMVEGVFVHVPQGTPYPYVVIGDVQARDWSALSVNGLEITLAIRVYSREAGNKKAQEILERIYVLLHNTRPTVSGHTVISLRFLSSDVVLEEDGSTYRGTLQLKAIIKQN